MSLDKNNLTISRARVELARRGQRNSAAEKTNPTERLRSKTDHAARGGQLPGIKRSLEVGKR